MFERAPTTTPARSPQTAVAYHTLTDSPRRTRPRSAALAATKALGAASGVAPTRLWNGPAPRVGAPRKGAIDSGGNVKLR